jgi:hypothetical protein
MIRLVAGFALALSFIATSTMAQPAPSWHVNCRTPSEVTRTSPRSRVWRRAWISSPIACG